MTRRLPWERTSGPAAATNSTGPTPRKQTKTEGRDITTPVSAPPATFRSPLVNRRRRVFDSDPLRSPSSSPPPAAPAEQFMIPGPQNDDRYRMVEDEFLHTAQKFTAHLHHAEYDRLKALAKRQNAATISAIERPVTTTPLTHTAKTKRATVQRATKQRRALREGSGSANGGDGDPAPWLGTSLHGLMESPRKAARHIDIPITTMSKTRASAGFTCKAGVGASSQVDPRNVVRRVFETPESQIHRRAVDSEASTARSTSSPRARFHESVGPSPTNIRRRAQANDTDIIVIDDDDDPFGVNQRRIHRQKSREQIRNQASHQASEETPDTMPSFL